MSSKTWILAIALSLVAPPLLAQTPSTSPLPLSPPESYARLGPTHWGHYHSVLTTTRPVMQEPGANTAVTDLRFQVWGSRFKVSCTAVAYFCAVQTTTVTMSAGTLYGQIVDNDAGKPDGTGSCIRVEPFATQDLVFSRRMFTQPNAIAARMGGYCSGNATTLGWACDASGDCGSAGTCNTSKDPNAADNIQAAIRGGFIVSRAPVATDCFVSEDQ